jgi:hypothetical protein
MPWVMRVLHVLSCCGMQKNVRNCAVEERGYGSVKYRSVTKIQQHCQILLSHLMESNQGTQRRRTNLGLIAHGSATSWNKHMNFSVLVCGFAYLLMYCCYWISQCERPYSKIWQESIYKLCEMGYNLHCRAIRTIFFHTGSIQAHQYSYNFI